MCTCIIEEKKRKMNMGNRKVYERQNYKLEEKATM